MIRLATLQDVPAMVALTKEYFPRLKNEGIAFNEDAFTDYARAFVEPSPIRAAFVSDANGELASFIFVALLLQPLTGETMALKCLWESARPGHGRSVLKAAEKWAASKGVKRFSAACFDAETERLLTMLGYRETERSFEKVLK